MLTLIAQIILIAGAVSPGINAATSYVSSLPPRPAQSAITCHDTQWEQVNLTTKIVPTNTKLQPFLEQLVADSRSNEVYFTFTSGYRTCEEQANLRAYACGTGDYNMNIKPIKDCVPPTEPAGKSLHNEGLAVDLACFGYVMFEYSPCYRWLKTNHLKYALFEHELEPWHWSTTGK